MCPGPGRAPWPAGPAADTSPVPAPMAHPGHSAAGPRKLQASGSTCRESAR